MHTKFIIMKTICVMVIFVLCSSMPVLAENHFSSSRTESSISVSSGEDYKVYIGAGIHSYHIPVLNLELFHLFQLKFGLGWYMLIERTGDAPVSGVCHMKTMTLSGEVIFEDTWPFYIDYLSNWTGYSGWTIELIPINFINITVEIENDMA